MFQLNKTSHLLTVTPDLLLVDIKKNLAAEGLFWGYHPLDEIHYSINHYLKRRIPNLYYYKYGSLSDVVNSAEVELLDGKTFHFKDAPRSAIGPDFNRMMIGGRSNFGKFKAVTLIVNAMPEKTSHGILYIDSKQQARQILRDLMGYFIQPLYFKYIDLDTTDTLMSDLKIKTAATECVAFCLSGQGNMVDTEQRAIDDYCKTNKLESQWLDAKTKIDVLNSFVHNPGSYKELRDQYRNLLWPSSDSSTYSVVEKDLINFMDIPPSE
jgi:hypothetical protein